MSFIDQKRGSDLFTETSVSNLQYESTQEFGIPLIDRKGSTGSTNTVKFHSALQSRVTSPYIKKECLKTNAEVVTISAYAKLDKI